MSSNVSFLWPYTNEYVNTKKRECEDQYQHQYQTMKLTTSINGSPNMQSRHIAYKSDWKFVKKKQKLARKEFID